jgi:hypothetical protein
MICGQKIGVAENATKGCSRNPPHDEWTLVGWRRYNSEPSLIGALCSLDAIDEASAQKVKLQAASECKIFVTL